MSIQGKKILITGSDGFVGKYLIKELKKKEVKIIGVDIQSGLDIKIWNQVKDIEAADIVCHLAAMMYVPFSWKQPYVVYNTNLLGTLNILEYCRLHDVQKIIFASSYLYGRPKYLPIDEKHPVAPVNPYARSKKIAEDICQGYSEDFGIKCIILRVFNIYGPEQNENFLIPTIINQLKKGKIELDNPEPKRDYVYIDDAVEAYINAIGYYESKFEIFNIGSQKSYSVDEITQKVIHISEREVMVNYRNKKRKNEIMDVIADIRKARRKLGWKPSVEIDDGLKNTMFGSGVVKKL